MAKECTHRQYYGQFVNDKLINYVSVNIGEKIIEASTDPHMNDIPMKKWDILNILNYIDKSAYKIANNDKTVNGILWSPSVNVCIGKEAARQYLDQLEDELCCGNEFIDGTDGRCLNCGSLDNL